MAVADSLSVIVGATTKPLEKGLKKASSLVGGFSTKASKVIAGGGGIGGAIGAALGGVTVAAGLKYAIDAFSEVEQAQAKLQGALRLSGGVAGVSIQQILGFAAQLSQTTSIGTAGALGMAAALARAGQIKGPNFQEAMKQSANLAAVMGTDGPAAAAKLAAALRNPAEGYLALAADGVAFSDAQIDAIQAMQNAGDVAGAQAVLLGALKSQMDGAAEAAGQTFTGQMDILHNSFQNLASIVGEAVMPAMKMIVGSISSWVQGLDTAANKASVFNFVAKAAGVVADTLQVLNLLWKAGEVAMGLLITGAVKGFELVVKGIGYVVYGLESIAGASHRASDGIFDFAKSCEKMTEAFADTTIQSAKEFGKAWERPWDSTKTETMFKTAQKQAQESAKAMGSAITGSGGPVAGMKQLTSHQIEAQSEATKLIRDLKEQVKYFGQDSYAQTAGKLSDKGASKGQVDQVKKLGAVLKGKELAESLENPLEKFQREMKKLNDLKAAGGVDAETFQRQKTKLTKDFMNSTPTEKASAGGALAANSVEARSAVLNYRSQSRNANPQVAIAKMAAAQVEEQKVTNRYLEKMATKQPLEHAPGI